MTPAITRIGRSIRSIYSKPVYVAINIAVAVLYYLLFAFLIRYQNYGILLITVPKPLLYTLIITASIMFTIGVYAMKRSFKRRSTASATAVGTCMTMFAGVISGCGCSVPIVYGITALGFSIGEVSVLDAFININSTYIISAIIAVNILLIFYYSLRISGKGKGR